MQGAPAQGARADRAPPPNAGAEPAPFRRPSADLVALYGLHAVREALRAGKRKLLDLYAAPGAAEKLAPDIAASGVRLTLVEPEALSRRLGPGAVHQGALLEARPIAPLDVSEITPRGGIALVLDQITDPHNVGAILRSAAAFDVDAVLMTERHAPEMTGVLAKAASGALEHVPIAPVVNLARALRELKGLGYLCVGLDSEGAADLQEVGLSAPVALVLGGEGKGLRRLTRETCDVVARLDMPGPIKSLNVSNAGAVALALVSRRLRG
ncbi:23S rRNA (guanosine(2251)-2'-O)-methyltransferase RlmB [Methylocella sp.]|uniref:23S rRNA (guanosine(2251)-2'-O)-methyltransferase RlmB n=1 Tax=Methylocella sp. TaxID=1978226 RepID=UPI00378513CA